MATNYANVKRLAGGRDVWGGHGVVILFYTGPSSYQGGAAGGDILDAVGGGTGTQQLPSNTSLRTIVAVISTNSASGNYEIIGGPAATLGAAGAARRFLLRWRVWSTGVEVSNTTNLSAETAILCVIGD